MSKNVRLNKLSLFFDERTYLAPFNRQSLSLSHTRDGDGTGGHSLSSGRSTLRPKSRSRRLLVNCLSPQPLVIWQPAKVVKMLVVPDSIWIGEIQLPVRLHAMREIRNAHEPRKR